MTQTENRPRHLIVLWAAHERYEPTVVAAWSASLKEAYPQSAQDRQAEAERWFLRFGDESPGEWQFYTTLEALPAPTPPSKCNDHEFGEWEDDVAGVVRVCEECGQVDWRPEG